MNKKAIRPLAFLLTAACTLCHRHRSGEEGNTDRAPG